ncbi:MAG: AraC family transcriptional regulator [Lysobacteraceae bacterium]|nr:MAG: AraC family transcriptional regulator [Xanthomonadaceae bacterium]
MNPSHSGQPFPLAADRGNAIELEPYAIVARWVAVSRLGSLRAPGSGFSIWIQLRGTSRLHAREGVFTLSPGEWLALDRDSAPDIQTSRHGVMIGLVLAAESSGCVRRSDTLPGRGRMHARDLRIALRLWRHGMESSAAQDDLAARSLQSMLSHIAALQCDLDGNVSRCPGRSIRRKRQVFGRMQRARLFLEGHRHRVVRLTELADLTSFSSWYLSKTYHEIYDESPQAASVRLRLEHACELLQQTDWSIGEIGAACGFDNSCSFARAFRTRYGMTASAYRMAPRPCANLGTCTKPVAQGEHTTRNVTLSMR